MNIILAGNVNMVPGFEIVIYSTMLHNKSINWHIFTMDIVVDTHIDDHTGYHIEYTKISIDDIRWLSFLIQYMDKHSNLVVHDVHDLYIEYLRDSVNHATDFTPYTSLRLLSDIVIPDPDALYLDADIIVQDNIEDAYHKYTTVNSDYSAYSHPDACDGFGEMIAGVMFLNLDHIRQSDFMHKARHFWKTVYHKFPDQNALRLAGDPYPLNETFNYCDDHKKAKYRPSILHFTHVNEYKIYTHMPGEFYRYYPEHKYIHEGLERIREVYRNYNR